MRRVVEVATGIGQTHNVPGIAPHGCKCPLSSGIIPARDLWRCWIFEDRLVEVQEALASDREAVDARESEPGTLTDRELQILAMLQSDLSLREIGGELYVSRTAEDKIRLCCDEVDLEGIEGNRVGKNLLNRRFLHIPSWPCPARRIAIAEVYDVDPSGMGPSKELARAAATNR